ncbi:MAG: peptidylprolyl isomerase [Bacteroidetes bacterium]|nr:peptidylprolyl isomerase [Bacteroidota bacterium]
MSTLQTLRERGGVLVAIIIGLALLAFILGDFKIGKGAGGRSKKYFEIAEIAGKSITYQDFEKKINKLTEIYKLSGNGVIDESTSEKIREQSWQQLIRENILDNEYKELGLGVCNEELFDLIQGNNPHLFIRQMFTDPQTGRMNKPALINFLKNMDNDPTQKAYWLFMEDEILNDRFFIKYTNLIRKGLYPTHNQAVIEFNESNKKVDFNYFVERFNTISDSAVTVNLNDLEKYYNEHKDDYKQSPARSIEYVIFSVEPSEADIAESEKWINGIKSEFEQAEDVKEFVNLTADTRFEDINHTPDEFPEIIRGFVDTAELGEVYGPYFENETYKLAKIAEINYLPDSVHVRHILISAGQNRSFSEAESTADSLKTLIRNGTNFNMIAITFSDDQGSAQLGGDLGWFSEGQMVKPFNDTCFQGKTGDLTIVETQFGFHIIEILDQSSTVKKFKVGIVDRKLEPSSTTYQNIYAEASRFAGMNNTYEKFNETIVGEGYDKRTANDLNPTDKEIPGLETPRYLIRSVFESKENEIVLDFNEQAVFELGDQFVIAYLSDVKKEGYSKLEDVESDIRLNVMKEKKALKIIENIKARMSETETIEELGRDLGVNIETATEISFNSFSIPGAGIEPQVIATAVNSDQGILTGPFIGNNGVYVITVTNITNPEETDLTAILNRLKSTYNSRAGYEAFEALKENADIVDSRSKFY